MSYDKSFYVSQVAPLTSGGIKFGISRVLFDPLLQFDKIVECWWGIISNQRNRSSLCQRTASSLPRAKRTLRCVHGALCPSSITWAVCSISTWPLVSLST